MMMILEGAFIFGALIFSLAIWLCIILKITGLMVDDRGEKP